MSFRRWDPVTDALRVLGLSGRPPREEIERAFRIAAKKHHPDGNAQGASPDPARFRRCLEARNLLLDRLHGKHRARASHPRPSWDPPPRTGHGKGSGNKAFFAKGFPFQTLHVLTTRSKVAVKGATGVLVLAMGLYDGYRRHRSRAANHALAP